MKNKYLNLTKNESIFIDDNLCLILCSENEKGHKCRPLTSKVGIPSYGMDLIKKIGCAILYTHDPANEGKMAEVGFSEVELYLFREIAESTVMYGEEPVGLNLKKKIHSLLFGEAYKKEKAFENIIANLNPPLAAETNIKEQSLNRKTE